MASVFRRTKKTPLPAGTMIRTKSIVTPRKFRRLTSHITWKGSRGVTLEGVLSQDQTTVTTHTAEWTDSGKKQSCPASFDGKSLLKPSGPYYATWKNHLGKRQTKCAGTTDRTTAEQLAAKLEADALKRREGLIDVDGQEIATQSRRSIEEHFKQYQFKLEAADNSPRYVKETIATLRRVAAASSISMATDIAAEKLQEYASELFAEGKSSRTVQSMLSTWQSFTSWLVEERKLHRDPLANIVKPSAESKRKYRRRMLLPSEWDFLRGVVASEPFRFGMSGADRLLLYRVAIQTGYRASELACVRTASCTFADGGTYIYLLGRDTKNGSPAKQYIDARLAADLKSHLDRREPGVAFDLPHSSNFARMIRKDLAAARKKWVSEVEGKPTEIAKRQKSCFLKVANNEGEVLDFHSLRHTCGAWLASTGTNPKTVQSVMRHSTITLTMDCYGHLFPGTEFEAAAKLGAMIDRVITDTCDGDTTKTAQRQVQQSGCEILQDDANRCEEQLGEEVATDITKSNSLADLGDVLQANATACESAPSWTRTMNLLIKSQLLCQLS